MKEEWKFIDGYNSYYQISNLGRVKSFHCGNRYKTSGVGKIMNCSLDGHGYKQVCLSLYGKSKLCLVHRLVAKAFIPNPNGYDVVNHIDEAPLNNKASNLEWCTKQYNSTYGYAGLYKNKPVSLEDEYGDITVFASIKEAHQKTNLPIMTIFNSCKRKTSMRDGRRWNYVNMPIPE